MLREMPSPRCLYTVGDRLMLQSSADHPQQLRAVLISLPVRTAMLIELMVWHLVLYSFATEGSEHFTRSFGGQVDKQWQVVRALSWRRQADADVPIVPTGRRDKVDKALKRALPACWLARRFFFSPVCCAGVCIHRNDDHLETRRS